MLTVKVEYKEIKNEELRMRNEKVNTVPDFKRCICICFRL
jgi:hypothetical protein